VDLGEHAEVCSREARPQKGPRRQGSMESVYVTEQKGRSISKHYLKESVH
ncbi:Superfamily II DNA and RNA helicase, partial [Giardia duodenalis]